jgi:hypothetical protein
MVDDVNLETVSREGPFGRLGRIANHRLDNNRDIKIIIVAEDSGTGVGKTTLAIHLCRYIDNNGWQANEKAFIDEIEHGADNRRASSTDNVELSQGWAKLRARNMATVATLPTTEMLDPRMLVLADFWVIVRKRGVAQPYEIKVNDFNGRVQRKPFPGKEHIKFGDLPDSDDDKQYLDQIKDKAVRGNSLETIPKTEHNSIVEDEREDAEQEMRDTLLAHVYRNSDMTHEQLSNLPSIDLSRKRVGQIINNR